MRESSPYLKYSMFGGTIYFAVDDTTQETSMEQTKPDSMNPELHNPFLSQASGIAQSVPNSSQWNIFSQKNLNSS